MYKIHWIVPEPLGNADRLLDPWHKFRVVSLASTPPPPVCRELLICVSQLLPVPGDLISSFLQRAIFQSVPSLCLGVIHCFLITQCVWPGCSEYPWGILVNSCLNREAAAGWIMRFTGFLVFSSLFSWALEYQWGIFKIYLFYDEFHKFMNFLSPIPAGSFSWSPLKKYLCESHMDRHMENSHRLNQSPHARDWAGT